MADLIWNESKLRQMIERLNQIIIKLEEKLETFNKNFDIIRRNWSGDEYNKAEQRLLAVKKSLETVLDDERRQKLYLTEKNNSFHDIVSGL